MGRAEELEQSCAWAGGLADAGLTEAVGRLVAELGLSPRRTAP